MSYIKDQYGIDVDFEQEEAEPTQVVGLQPIGYPENPYPIPYHPTHDWFDSTKLSAYRDCGRKFFFEYMLGWSPRQGNINLVFGSAIHEALEHFYASLMNGGPGVHQDNLKGAWNAFMDYWESNFNSLTMATRSNKTPKRALEILSQYIKEYPQDNTEYEVLFTETVGDVPLDAEGLKLRVKMDVILRHKQEGYVIAREHKTCSAFGQTWVNQWETEIQPGSYQYALQGMFPNTRGIEINALIFRSKDYPDKPNFFRQIYYRPHNQMALWLAEVYDLIDRYERDRRILVSVGEKMKAGHKQTAMPCFFRGPCKWGCTFPTLCTHWTNPLEHNIVVPPPAYKLRFWDPATEKHSSSIRQTKEGLVVELTKIMGVTNGG